MEIGQRLMSVFAGLTRAHGVYETGDVDHRNKVKGRAVTKLEPVTLDLWDNHLSGKTGLGIVPIRDDATCLFGAIDIDSYDGLDLAAIEGACLTHNLPLIVCRSKSGGAHIYCFTAEPVSAEMLRKALVEWATLLGYPKTEVFPKQIALTSSGDVGNWINMPYFNAANTTRYAINAGKAVDAEEFLRMVELTRATVADLTTRPADAALPDAPPCLQHLARVGFSEGGRNNALFNLGVYARLRAAGDAQWLQGGEDWSDKVVGYNSQFMDPPLERSELRDVLHSLKRRNYFYLCSQPPIVQCCNKQVCAQRRYGIGQQEIEDAQAFQIDNPRRVLTDPVTWILTLNGMDVEFTTDMIMDQSLFKKRVVEKIKVLMPPLTKRAWSRTLERVITESLDIEAPVDAGPEGRLVILLEAFCTVHSNAAAEDELLLGRPWNNEGRTFFRGSDFLRYLDQHHYKALREAAIWAVLRRMGAEHTIRTIKGKSVTCWSVAEFARQTEPFSPVRVDVEEF